MSFTRMNGGVTTFGGASSFDSGLTTHGGYGSINKLGTSFGPASYGTIGMPVHSTHSYIPTTTHQVGMLQGSVGNIEKVHMMPVQQMQHVQHVQMVETVPMQMRHIEAVPMQVHHVPVQTVQTVTMPVQQTTPIHHYSPPPMPAPVIVKKAASPPPAPVPKKISPKPVKAAPAREIIKEVEVIKEIEVPVDKYIYVDVPKEVEKEVFVEKIVQVPVEVVKIVEKVVERIVEVPVEKIVYRDREVPVDRVVEKIVEVEKRVEVPVDRIVEKVVTKEVPVDRIVERVVERPQEISAEPARVLDIVESHSSGLIPVNDPLIYRHEPVRGLCHECENCEKCRLGIAHSAASMHGSPTKMSVRSAMSPSHSVHYTNDSFSSNRIASPVQASPSYVNSGYVTSSYTGAQREVGLGLSIVQEGDIFVIDEIVPGYGGAASAQLQVGDEVRMVDGHRLSRLGEIKELTVADEGTWCTLVVCRGYNGVPFEVNLQRIMPNSVSYQHVHSQISRNSYRSSTSPGPMSPSGRVSYEYESNQMHSMSPSSTQYQAASYYTSSYGTESMSRQAV